MEQTAWKRSARHAGWSEEENRLLWETADEAQQQGLPLKQVFDRIAERTGRRPNSIRNYYYAQVRQKEGAARPAARFVPFGEQEVTDLIEKVLRARAAGQSVRSCLQQMAGGDHSLMLRYQNKYRSILKNRPQIIEEAVDRLKAEGVDCSMPQFRPRQAGGLDQACAALNAAAQSVSDGELIRACETLTHLMLGGRDSRAATQADRLHVRLELYRLALDESRQANEKLCEAADQLTLGIKEFLVLEPEARTERLDGFCREMSEKIGLLESRIGGVGGQILPLNE